LGQAKSLEAAKRTPFCHEFSWQAVRERQTMNIGNVILLVTSCSVRKVHHIQISQCLKFQGVLEFVCHQLVASPMIISEPPTQRKTTFLVGC